MGQVLDGSVTTTEAVRRAIQHSQESLRGLAKRYGVNPKTVATWKVRTSVSDLPTGPKEPRSTVLSGEEEAVVIAFRRHTLLPLDDCLYGFSQSSRICPVRRCIAACSATGSRGCRRSRAKPRPCANPRPIRLAILISTSPRFELRLLMLIGAYLFLPHGVPGRWLLARARRQMLSATPSPPPRRDGGVAERLKAHAWKVCMRETVSRVRIPPPPPTYL